MKKILLFSVSLFLLTFTLTSALYVNSDNIWSKSYNLTNNAHTYTWTYDLEYYDYNKYILDGDEKLLISGIREPLTTDGTVGEFDDLISLKKSDFYIKEGDYLCSQYKTKNTELKFITYIKFCLSSGNDKIEIKQRQKYKDSTEYINENSKGFLNLPTAIFKAEEMICIQEVKQCSDGSFVSRTGPNCEFAACSVVSPPYYPKAWSKNKTHNKVANGLYKWDYKLDYYDSNLSSYNGTEKLVISGVRTSLTSVVKHSPSPSSFDNDITLKKNDFNIKEGDYLCTSYKTKNSGYLKKEHSSTGKNRYFTTYIKFCYSSVGNKMKIKQKQKYNDTGKYSEERLKIYIDLPTNIFSIITPSPTWTKTHTYYNENGPHNWNYKFRYYDNGSNDYLILSGIRKATTSVEKNYPNPAYLNNEIIIRKSNFTIEERNLLCTDFFTKHTGFNKAEYSSTGNNRSFTTYIKFCYSSSNNSIELFQKIKYVDSDFSDITSKGIVNLGDDIMFGFEPDEESCPVYDVRPAPVGCYYNEVTLEDGCTAPRLVCESAPIVCTMDYTPVCAKTSIGKKTYSNKCMMELAGETFLYEGECKIDDALSNEKKEILDKAIKKLINDLEKTYNSPSSRIGIIDNIIVRLKDISKEKPEFKDIVEYIVIELEDYKNTLELVDIDNDLEDLFNSFN